MISIQQIQYILTLSEEKQFQKASERCFVTQPTLSMQVKKAEQILGGQLFDRSRSPLEMTPFGNELLPIFTHSLNVILGSSPLLVVRFQGLTMKI